MRQWWWMHRMWIFVYFLSYVLGLVLNIVVILYLKLNFCSVGSICCRWYGRACCY